MAVVKAVCISKRKGTEKKPVPVGHFIEEFGIEGDAHAGNWHRQVSLLSYEKVEEFNQRGGWAADGDFGENLLVKGADFGKMPVGTRLYCNGVVMEITQIGKECHNHCAIYHRVGDCIMPREGVFARVIAGGEIRPGDEMRIEEKRKKELVAAVITLSDKGYAGERMDESGPVAKECLLKEGYEIAEMLLLPDDREEIEKNLIRLADKRQVDLILTTGGTGFAVRDCTPEATMNVATRNAPGIAEAIRYGSMQITKRAMLGRGVSVIRNNTLIVNLPGSPKAVKEGLDYVLKDIRHGIEILKGSAKECAARE
jgi:molybdopterin adenylyltransferase